MNNTTKMVHNLKEYFSSNSDLCALISHEWCNVVHDDNCKHFAGSRVECFVSDISPKDMHDIFLDILYKLKAEEKFRKALTEISSLPCEREDESRVIASMVLEAYEE